MCMFTCLLLLLLPWQVLAGKCNVATLFLIAFALEETMLMVLGNETAEFSQQSYKDDQLHSTLTMHLYS